jgi:pimeloyl-ACP methyl ester carboxylesterase
MPTFLLMMLIIILVIIGYIFFIVYASQEFVFNPKKKYIYYPEIKHDDIFIDGRLKAWHFNNYPGRKTILFCHGNYGNISYSDFLIDICDKNKINLLIFDYSGYGESTGYPSQRQICADGDKAYEYLRQTLGPEDIIVWGMSLGGAVATHISSRHPCSHLILMSTFSSLDDIILDSKINPWLNFYARMVAYIIDTLPSRQKIERVKCPIIIMHSPEDELIPITNSYRLFEKIPHQCKKFITIGGKHASPVITSSHMEEIFKSCCLNISGCPDCQDVLSRLPKLVEIYEEREKALKTR